MVFHKARKTKHMLLTAFSRDLEANYLNFCGVVQSKKKYILITWE